MADLVFQSPPNLSGHLVFGDAPVGSIPLRTIDVLAYRTKPAASAVLSYDNRVTRWLSQTLEAPQQPARGATQPLASAWGLSQTVNPSTAMPWQPALPLNTSPLLVYGISPRVAVQTGLLWQLARAHSAHARFVLQDALARERDVAGTYEQAQRIGREMAQPLQVAEWLLQAPLVSAWQRATPRDGGVLNLMGVARRAGRAVQLPWQVALWWRPGRTPHPSTVQPPFVPHVGDPELLFQCPPNFSGHLVFGPHPCEQAGVPALLYILPARYYMATHSLSAVLLPSLEPVALYDATIAADFNSVAWSFSASGPDNLLEQLAPSGRIPKLVRVTLDGMPWVFEIRTLRRTWEFGRKTVQVTGVSQTLSLGAPHAPDTFFNNAAPATAQQLAEQAVGGLGFDVDWGLEDWLVPAGAWSFNGTPLAAVQAIAQAAGGYLQSAPDAQIIMVRHPYPTLPGGVPGGPWNWSGAFAADVELAPDARVSQSLERQDRADANAVYVSGQNQGVLALVKRIGSAGDKLLPMAVDSLITAQEAAQQRGLAALGAEGSKEFRDEVLPVLTGGANPGVLRVGQLVQFNDAVPWRGRVRAVSVQASMPQVRQTVTVERHLA